MKADKEETVNEKLNKKNAWKYFSPYKKKISQDYEGRRQSNRGELEDMENLIISSKRQKSKENSVHEEGIEKISPKSSRKNSIMSNASMHNSPKEQRKNSIAMSRESVMSINDEDNHKTSRKNSIVDRLSRYNFKESKKDGDVDKKSAKSSPVSNFSRKNSVSSSIATYRNTPRRDSNVSDKTSPSSSSRFPTSRRRSGYYEDKPNNDNSKTYKNNEIEEFDEMMRSRRSSIMQNNLNKKHEFFTENLSFDNNHNDEEISKKLFKKSENKDNIKNRLLSKDDYDSDEKANKVYSKRNSSKESEKSYDRRDSSSSFSRESSNNSRKKNKKITENKSYLYTRSSRSNNHSSRKSSGDSGEEYKIGIKDEGSEIKSERNIKTKLENDSGNSERSASNPSTPRGKRINRDKGYNSDDASSDDDDYYGELKVSRKLSNDIDYYALNHDVNGRKSRGVCDKDLPDLKISSARNSPSILKPILRSKNNNVDNGGMESGGNVLRSLLVKFLY